MELYYHDDVQMQENEESPRIGKIECLQHEKKLLSNIRSLDSKIIHQVIHQDQNIVFTELEMRFCTLDSISYVLKEVSVQEWKDNKVFREKFYYKEILKV